MSSSASSSLPSAPTLNALPLGTHVFVVASDLAPWLNGRPTVEDNNHHPTAQQPDPASSNTDSILASLPVAVRTVGTLYSCDPHTQTASLSLALHDMTPLHLQASTRPLRVTLHFDLVPAMAGFPLGSTVDVCGELKQLAKLGTIARDTCDPAAEIAESAAVGIHVRFARVVDGMDVRLWAATAKAVRKAWVL